MIDSIKEGEKLFADGKVEESELIFNSILKKDPENLDAINYLGIIAYQNGDIEESVGYFTKALTIDPYHKNAVFNICEVYRKINRLSVVSPLLKKIIEKYPEDESLIRLLEEASSSELPEKENINSAEYWDNNYQKEVGTFEWRRNVVCFGKIKSVLGILGDFNDTLLDIGCGYGLLLDLLLPLGFQLSGWDISGKAVSTINEKGHNGRCLDFTKYEYSEKDVVDHVVSSELLEHVREPHEILKKMYKLARKTIIIAVPDNCLEDAKEHLQCFDEKTFRALVENFTFRKIFIDSCLEEFLYTMPDGKTDVIKRPTLLAILIK